MSADTIASAIATAARKNFDVDLDVNDPDYMNSLATAILSQSDLSRVEAFVADLVAAGIPWPRDNPREMRPTMEYRVYEIPLEMIGNIVDDEPSVGRNLDSSM